MKTYIIKRLGELSTWKGILAFLVGIGLFTLTDSQTEAIATAMVAVYAAMSALLPDKLTKDK